MQKFNAAYDGSCFPKKVILQIRRARDQYLTKAAWKEPTSEAKSCDYTTFSENDGTKDNEEAIAITSTLPVCDPLQDDDYDYGKTFDWDKPRYALSSQQKKDAETWLDTMVASQKENNLHNQGLSIPTRHDGTEYMLCNASDDQAQVLCHVIHHLRQWFDPSVVTKPEPLRLVISGVAGSGKSTLTNTLVTAIRKMFGTTNSVKVVAPTGQAAFNAGGTTCHHGLGVGVNRTVAEGISPTTLKELLRQNQGLVMLVFDERSLVSSKLLARCHYNMSQTAYGGKNKNKDWGNIPILLFVGDDYQLPSVENGCLSIFDETAKHTDEESYGNRVFTRLASKVVCLKESKRQHGSETTFLRILRCLRCEEPDVSHAFIPQY
jgi:hypothetical protein